MSLRSPSPASHQALEVTQALEVSVIGAGWGRTGTSSFKKALEILGYEKVYHMTEVFGSHEHLWAKLANKENIDIHEMLSGYTATSDWYKLRY